MSCPVIPSWTQTTDPSSAMMASCLPLRLSSMIRWPFRRLLGEIRRVFCLEDLPVFVKSRTISGLDRRVWRTSAPIKNGRSDCFRCSISGSSGKEYFLLEIVMQEYTHRWVFDVHLADEPTASAHESESFLCQIR